MDVPTELMRSWVGQDVTVLAYSAGTPRAPTPEEASAVYPVTLDCFAGRLRDISGLGVGITTARRDK